jgi:zearalenone synthase (nonreducing iterative type I polyketide synthase)
LLQAVPEIKRVRVAVVGKGWSTIIGPPSVLNKFLTQCPAVKSLPRQETNIRALFHSLTLSELEMAELLGSSSLLDHPAGSCPWKSVVQTACEQILTRPCNIVETVEDLNHRLASVKNVDLNIIGISAHESFIVEQLRATGKNVVVRHEHSIPSSLPTSIPDSSRKIAIVGMAGRSPGAHNLAEFWRIIVTGQDLHKEIPEDRFDINEFFNAAHDGKCTTSTRFGCFMDNPGSFDARFFNISPREALLMEPTHRLWLMTVYEALEMAGYSAGRTRAVDPNRIGAFFGQSVDDWLWTTHQLGCDSYTMPGIQRAFGPGRVNFHFKWEGPTYSVDSACASSSCAITLACQNLLGRECDMAVAGGANILSDPHYYSALSRAGVLSPTGGCKTFRDDADGYCRGEFAGAVVLKRMEDALAANDNILAVIAASGRNHAGNAPSTTTSDAGSQGRLFRQVLRKANVRSEDVAYIEMHGTGTQVGDLAEMNAVVNTFRRPNGSKNPLRVGSIKANIGHGEASAGIASLLKCILSFQQGFIPPVANMPHKVNPKFPDLGAANIEIPSQRVEFNSVSDKKRRMMLNNFDASGGNTCLLVEDFVSVTRASTDPRPCHIVTLSAKSVVSHTENKKRLLNFLRAGAHDYRIEDLAYTTTSRRMHYPIRSAITASSIKEVIDKLSVDIKEDVMADRVSTPPVIFMFTGQGSHYAGMGFDLYKSSPAFRNTIDLCKTICNQLDFPEFSDIITVPSIDISGKDTVQTQLAIVSLEIALASFWMANGVEPAMVMGHSLGEYVALHVAGVLSLTDVLYLVGRRAQLVLQRCQPDAFLMLSVDSPLDKVMAYTRRDSACEIACINSPSSTVLSGPTQNIKVLKEELKRDTTSSQELRVQYGFHSSHVDAVLDDYANIARGVLYSPPKIPIASTATAAVIETSGIIDEMYLCRQMREKVDFIGGLKAAIGKLKTPIFLEVGPGHVLSHFARATLDTASGAKTISTLRGSNEGQWSSISKSVALMYTAGVEIDWTAFHQPYTEHVKVITLPSYSWDLKNYWLKWAEPREGPLALTAAAPVAHVGETVIIGPAPRSRKVAISQARNQLSFERR